MKCGCAGVRSGEGLGGFAKGDATARHRQAIRACRTKIPEEVCREVEIRCEAVVEFCEGG
jgi:hypothetical protein